MTCPECSAVVPFDAKVRCPACGTHVAAARAKERGSSAGARLAAIWTFVVLGAVSCVFGVFWIGVTERLDYGTSFPIWFGIACFSSAAGTRRL